MGFHAHPPKMYVLIYLKNYSRANLHHLWHHLGPPPCAQPLKRAFVLVFGVPTFFWVPPPTTNPGNEAKARFLGSGHRLAATTMPPTLKMSIRAHFQGGGILLACGTTTTSKSSVHARFQVVVGFSLRPPPPLPPRLSIRCSTSGVAVIFLLPPPEIEVVVGFFLPPLPPPQNRVRMLDFGGGGHHLPPATILLLPPLPPPPQSSTDARFWEWWSSSCSRYHY